MTTKYPFSEVGFVALQQMLYAQTDEQLHLEALSANYEFSDWLLRYFELSPTQVLFLASLTTGTRQFLGNQTAFALANRLTISLAKEPSVASRAEGDDDDDEGKIIWTTNSLSVADGTTGYDANRALTIHIAYPEV